MEAALKRSSCSVSSGSSPAKSIKQEAEYGTSGTPVTLVANYFEIHKMPTFQLTQYRVDFVPDIDLTQKRKQLIGQNREKLGGRYVFDGASLYLSKNFDHMELESNFDGRDFKITIRKTGSIRSSDQEAFQIFNLIIRESMSCLQLQNIKRDYFDPKAKIDVPEGKLELWPGYVTSIRAHGEDSRMLMNAEISHKFMRKETVMDIMSGLVRRGSNWQLELEKLIIGTTVLTEYTNKTYRIDSIDFTMTPMSKFTVVGKTDDTTYAAYYMERYNIEIKDKNQCMLVSQAREKDIRAGHPEFIYLIPELCRATGMTEEMRSNFKLMQQLSEYTRMNPQARVKNLKRFNQRIQNTPESLKVLDEWQMQLDSELIKISGRELAPESIVFDNNVEMSSNAKGEWMIKGNMSMYKSVPVARWICLCPESMKGETEEFIKKLKTAHETMNCPMKSPKICALLNDRQETYVAMIKSVAEMNPSIILIILPNNRADRYSAVKKECLINQGIPAQVVCGRILKHKNVQSIATKIAIQMNAKLGGIPWMIKLPVKGLMTVAFDVSIHPRDRSRSIGAMVATMDMKKTGTFYSITSEYRDGNEMNNSLAAHMEKALKIYKEECEVFPEKIIFYRDGVGEGQIQSLMTQEINPLLSKLRTIYAGEEPKLAYIIVNKRINTRLFTKVGEFLSNPKPGTVVDRDITISGRNDFFLVSQHVGQGTVAPTAYNIIHNSTGLNKDKIEIITYKMTHMYFNWSGTTRIPAVCQYAKKLAFMTSQSLQAPVHANLERSLYFL